MHWGMAVDLKLCIGCNTCVISCKAGNGTPPGIFWAKVLEKEEGTYPLARRTFWPIRCMHCEEPACLRVCPTGATYQRQDGLVLVDSEKCAGCRACILACPYESRALWEGGKYYFGNLPTPYETVAYKRHRPGTVQKCDFCVERIDQGLKPYCVTNCLTGALIFGDLDNPNSEVSEALRKSGVYFRPREELGTRPSIYYLA